MNILLINHYAGSPYYGMEYRPFYLAREWVKAGHRVTIIAASQSHVRAIQPEIIKSFSEEDIEGIQYIWIGTPQYKGNGFGRVRNMSAFIVRLWSHAIWLAEKLCPEVVIASSTYPLDIYPARKIAHRSEALLIFEVHDLWPLSPIELGGMSKWHPFIIGMQMAENYAYRVADRVVSMLPKAIDHMVAHGMAAEKYAHIPNGINIAEWEVDYKGEIPIEHTRLFSEIHKEGRLIIGYVGAHGIANALDSFIESSSLLLNDNVELVLIGHGPQKDILQKKARNNKYTNVHFLPPVRKKVIPAILEKMDALYIGLQHQPLFRFGVSPNKLMDYMMAGKPVIYAIEAGNDPVMESGCGISIKPENPQALAGAVRQLLDMSEAERKEMGAKGRNFVVINHNYSVLAERYQHIMTEKAGESRCTPR